MLPETTTPENDDAAREHPRLTTPFASTPQGAQRARRLAVRWMGERGYPPLSDASCTVALVVAELAANAVQHARVPGHRHTLSLTLDPTTNHLRVEVADAASAKRVPASAPCSYPSGESGRGLFLVDLLATRWGSTPREPLGKTVWAELHLE